MAERDGTIVIDTQIDTKGVDAGSEKTEASLRRMAQKVNDIGATAKAALNKQIDAFARLNSQYDSQSEKIDALKRKIAGYSDEYGEMQAKIDETVKKLNDLEMMQGVIKDAVKDSAKRGTTFDTTQYKWVQEDIEKLTKEIEVAEREQDKLFATGIQSNSGLASKLFITLTEGCGYDKICTFASVPARKTDYQAYLRKALKILNDMLLLKNMPADFPAEKI